MPRLTAHRSVIGRRIPQPVRLVTWLLVALATVDWFYAISTRGGPKNPGHNGGGIVDGFVCIALVLLIGSRRRVLYDLTLVALAAFVVVGIVDTRSLAWGVLIGAPSLAFLALLLLGRGRYRSAAGSRHTV